MYFFCTFQCIGYSFFPVMSGRFSLPRRTTTSQGRSVSTSSGLGQRDDSVPAFDMNAKSTATREYPAQGMSDQRYLSHVDRGEPESWGLLPGLHGTSENRRQVFNYTDHLQDPIIPSNQSNRLKREDGYNAPKEEGSLDFASNSAKVPAQNRFPTSAIDKMTFPEILYNLLDDVIIEGLQSIISWSHHGRAFHVHDRPRFETQIMPR